MDDKANKQANDKLGEKADDNKRYWFGIYWYRIWPNTWQGPCTHCGFHWGHYTTVIQL